MVFRKREDDERDTEQLQQDTAVLDAAIEIHTETIQIAILLLHLDEDEVRDHSGGDLSGDALPDEGGAAGSGDGCEGGEPSSSPG